jgi:hypothetical protein
MNDRMRAMPWQGLVVLGVVLLLSSAGMWWMFSQGIDVTPRRYPWPNTAIFGFDAGPFWTVVTAFGVLALALGVWTAWRARSRPG